MQVKGIACPFCGAPISYPEGSSKCVCLYCGKESYIEFKMIENIEKKVSAKFQNAESQTQLEIKRLQLTQELSMLQMQLSNLKSEKRNLERDKSRKTRNHLKQINNEESLLLSRIEALQNTLNNPKPSDHLEKTGYLTSYEVSNCSYSTTLFLAIFTGLLGGHRYYTGKIGSAIIQTFTLGGFYIWWIIDIISILSGGFKDSKGRSLDKTKKANPVLVKTILSILLGMVIMSVIYTATGSTGNESYAPIIFIGSFALSTILVNIKKIYSSLSAKNKNGNYQ
jgi:uncharacterized Zn finger protein (UPF0148 family)